MRAGDEGYRIKEVVEAMLEATLEAGMRAEREREYQNKRERIEF